MNRRVFLKTVGLGAAALGGPGCRTLAQAGANAGTGNPNIVFIMTDDMGYGDTTVYNPESKIPTPNMEKLAKQGMMFTDAHSPSAVCTPTRYGVLTGRYCWRSRLKRGVFGGFNRPLIERDRLTVASMLKQHGYGTACIGKWHLGLDWTLKEGRAGSEQRRRAIDFTKPILSGPTELGFDYYFCTAGNPTDDPPELFIENHRIVYMEPEWEHEKADTTFTEKSIEFIEQHVAGSPDRPFFLYFGVAAPHIPWLPPEFVKGKSQAGLRGDQVFLADWILGRIMDTLDKLNVSDNTLLIFTSDNGPREGVNGHKSSGNLRGQKGEIWEGGHRVPFIARWPGKIKPGTASGEVTTLTDLIATCAAVVGAELPRDAGQDSYNMLPALLGEKLDRPIREATVHHSGAGVFAIRQGEWKLILGTKEGGYHAGGPKPGSPGQLYNLDDDPYEKNDLWDKEPRIVERLTRLLQKYVEEGRSRP